jgi:hypothetical protein
MLRLNGKTGFLNRVVETLSLRRSMTFVTVAVLKWIVLNVLVRSRLKWRNGGFAG